MKLSRLSAGAGWALACLFLVPFSCGAQTEELEQFARKMPLTVTGNDGLYQVKLPLAVYKGAAFADLRDLRVFNGQGERVPMAFLPELPRETVSRSSVKLPIFPLFNVTTSTVQDGIDMQIRRNADGTLVTWRTGKEARQTERKLVAYLVDASRLTQSLRSLDFDWKPGADTHQADLVLEGSDDLRNWRWLGSGTLVSLEFAGEQLSQRHIDIAPTRARYLRLTWTRGDLDLHGLEAETVATSKVSHTEISEMPATPGEKAGEYQFDVGAGLPVERARMLLPATNTLAPTQLLTRTVSTAAWRPLTSATFYRLNLEGRELVSPPTAVRIPGDRFWLARVDQRSGGIGKELPKLEVTWSPGRIAFVARGQGPFSLAYGNPQARAGSLDAAVLIPGYQPGADVSLPQANTGAEIASNAVAPPAEEERIDPAARKRYMLWGLLVLGVAVMGWMAMRLGRDMKENPSKDNPPQ